MKYYSLNNILSRHCQYNIILGERSNGKTFAVLEYGIRNYFKTGKQMAIIRRWLEDFRGKRARTMFDGVVDKGIIYDASKGEYDDVKYFSGEWHFIRHNDKGDIIKEMNEPFAYAFSIAQQEHDKSTSYPNIDTIFFDEFTTRDSYLVDEFILFMNTLSTIIRNRNDVIIFMCGNTVNRSSPYFTEMGLSHIRDMKQGDIDVYSYGESELHVAVEFSDSIAKRKPSDIYFAFNNPKLQMITGTGSVWEMALYPHCPCKFVPDDIMFMYFIIFENRIYQCELVNVDDLLFTYIHRKTTPIKDVNSDLIYTPEYSPKQNYHRYLNDVTDKVTKYIYNQYVHEKVFYQDNEVGEDIRNYLQFCGMSTID